MWDVCVCSLYNYIFSEWHVMMQCCIISLKATQISFSEDTVSSITLLALVRASSICQRPADLAICTSAASLARPGFAKEILWTPMVSGRRGKKRYWTKDSWKVPISGYFFGVFIDNSCICVFGPKYIRLSETTKNISESVFGQERKPHKQKPSKTLLKQTDEFVVQELSIVACRALPSSGAMLKCTTTLASGASWRMAFERTASPINGEVVTCQHHAMSTDWNWHSEME